MKMRHKRAKLPTILLALCMVMSLMPLSAFAENSTVSNETELKSALENADFAEIKLGGNIETGWGLEVNRTVTLDLNGYTLSCSSTDDDIFLVRSSGNLTVKDSGTGGKIDGQKKNCGFEVKGGTLTLESGNIVNCTDADGDGGAVDVSNTGVTETPIKYGRFIMNGGTIAGCKSGDDGAAVDIGKGCTFTLNSGTISGCRAEDDGGAVFIKQGAFFVMNGGTIENCSAYNNGGAVNIYQDGSFTMTGGTIKDCKVDLGGYGNAVYGKDNTAIVAISGGTIENCGVYPWSFDEFTVTFDSDGGSTVAEQKLLNSPAIKPTDPKKKGYDFVGWYLGDTQYTFDTNIAKNITLKAKWKIATTSSSITSVDVQNIKLNYQPGNSPQPTAKRTGDNQDKYDILFERWEKREKDANGTVNTVSYWYSDESEYLSGNSRFDTFENGGSYRYSVKLKAKDGYTFDSSLTNGQNVTINGASLPSDSAVTVTDSGKVCTITYGTEMLAGKVIKKIDFDALTNFNVGDKPRFNNSEVNPFIDLDHEQWDANDGSGYGITSSDYWNGNYNGKLITEFEAGKSYTYSVYFKISDLGLEEGYHFDKSTKLCINNKEITLTPDQIDVFNNGGAVWYSNVLTMQPYSATVIDVVEINDVTISFKGGDKPVFTGKVPDGANYAYRCEWWELDSKTGAMSTDFGNFYENKITAFEAGKTYHYGVYITTIYGDRYVFGPDTKLKINGEFVNYKRYEGDTSDGSDGTMWVITDLTMTPQASGMSPDYKITEGANGSWRRNSDGSLKFVANGDFSKFVGVKIDGVLIDPDNYTAVSGSTEITLKKEFLDTLSVGKHTLTVVYSDGECSTEFKIKAAGNASDNSDTDNNSHSTKPSEHNNSHNAKPSKHNKTNTTETTSPKTGYATNMLLLFGILFFGGNAIIGIMIIQRKKKRSK